MRLNGVLWMEAEARQDGLGTWYVNLYGRRPDDAELLRRETIAEELTEKAARMIANALNKAIDLCLKNG